MNIFIIILSLSILFNNKYDLEPITLSLSKFIMIILSLFYDIHILTTITLFSKSSYYFLNKTRNFILFMVFLYHFYSINLDIDEKLIYNFNYDIFFYILLTFPLAYFTKYIYLLYDNKLKRYIDTIKGSYITDTIYAFLLYEEQSLTLEDMFIYSLFLDLYLNINYSNFYYYFFIIGIFNIKNSIIIIYINYLIYLYGIIPCIPLFFIFQYV